MIEIAVIAMAHGILPDIRRPRGHRPDWFRAEISDLI
jgi:hypothetical protein